VERAATSFGESEGGLATHRACAFTKVVEMKADLKGNKTILRCKGEMVCQSRRRMTWLVQNWASPQSQLPSKACSRGSKSCEDAGVFVPTGEAERQLIGLLIKWAPKKNVGRGSFVLLDGADWTLPDDI
jgi:hypothetical protein